jgi:subfamily B ATP-binding cassette protein MsbA
MKRFFRLAGYVAPYWFQSLLGVVLLAAVGLLEALRLAILQPVFGPVLNPGAKTTSIPLFPKLAGPYQFDLMKIVPSHFHNAWTVVAFALIMSTVIKGICDYVGTYMVNYAGYGMITDLRNHLYETIMKSSASFFHKHATGTILSTLINDVERVQTAVSGAEDWPVGTGAYADRAGPCRGDSEHPA